MSEGPYVGRCVLTGKGEEFLGRSTLPDCNHMWRSAGPCTADISSYASDVGEAFPETGMCSLSNAGGSIIRQSGGLYPALVDFQECEMRNRADQLVFARGNHTLFPAKYPEITGSLDQGGRAVYDKGVGLSSRVRGLNYNATSSDQTELIAKKLWKDISSRRIFV